MRIRHAAATAAAITLIGTVIAAPAQAASGTPWYGCAYGDVCIYNDNQTDLSQAYIIWEHGAYRTYNLSGFDHYNWILNNQYGGAHVKICTGYNGGGSCEVFNAGTGGYRNFYPINSVVIYP